MSKFLKDKCKYDYICRYQWTAGNAGTHFWHAHTGLQKMDGLYGSIVVRQPPSKDPNSNLYDYDLTTHVILISDWMHEDAAERFPGRLAVNTGQDPETVLINGKGQFRVRFKILNFHIEYLKFLYIL
jgi:FtsP/CotA-like multicopper oxidase with cupredoxin domain